MRVKIVRGSVCVYSERGRVYRERERDGVLKKRERGSVCSDRERVCGEIESECAWREKER